MYFEDCPNWRTAEARLAEALVCVGRSPSAITRQMITTPEETEAVGFGGSPTILVDGRDPFASPGVHPVGLACRLYPGASGPEGAPSVAELVEVLAHAG